MLKIGVNRYLEVNSVALKDIGNVPVYLLYSILQYADGDDFYTDRESMQTMCEDLKFSRARVNLVLKKLNRAGILEKTPERCHYKVNLRMARIKEKNGGGYNAR